jgi:trk system potassium uptake protein TrkA
MHVVVVGCGRVGSELAGTLQASGHTVAVVDKSIDAFRRLGPHFGGQKVVGYGFDRSTLAAAGIDGASALAAVTSGDNSNIVTARVARENFGIERVVARIYDPRRASIFQKLGIPTVATVSWTTDQVMRRLMPAEHHSEWLDPTGAVALVELAVPAGLAGVKLAALNSPGKWWLTSVTRLGTARVTTDTLVLQEGDVAHFVVEAAAIPELRERVAAGRGEH